ncbi:hypothetical protein RGO69_002299 [Morganella morganii]|nr:hypothetical protein [Morganella morganii]
MTKYKLHGYISPINNSPSFMIPIFKNNNNYYIQDIDDNKIKSFKEIDLGLIRGCNVYEGEDVFFAKVGLDALFCVLESDGHVTVDTKEKMICHLINKAYDYIGNSFFYREISDFCNISLPEYYNCKSDRDFLIRQLISNTVTRYSNEVRYLIEFKESKGKGFQINNVNNRYEKIKGLYNDFICYLFNENKKLYNEREVKNSVAILNDILSSIENNLHKKKKEILVNYICDFYICNELDYTQKVDFCLKTNSKYLISCDDGFFNKYHSYFSEDENEGISTVFFVTSRLWQELYKKREF